MKLSSFIDIGRRLHLDQSELSYAELIARDGRIGRLLGEEIVRENDKTLLLAWEERIREEEGSTLGLRLGQALGWTAFLLLLLGIFSGAATAAIFLRPETPINVQVFFLAVIGSQVALLAVMLFGILFRKRVLVVVRPVQGALTWLLVHCGEFAVRFSAGKRIAGEIHEEVAALKAGRHFYRGIHNVLILNLAQFFGIGFNVGVLLLLLFFGTFYNLTFSWQTTRQIEAKEVHRLTEGISLPWKWIAESATLDCTKVKETMYPAATRDGSERWWHFLIAASITYGLMPRLVIWLGGKWLLQYRINSRLRTSRGVERLLWRLRGAWAEEDPEPEERGERLPEPEPVRSGLKLAVVYWAYDQQPPLARVEKLLRSCVGGSVAEIFEAGQLDRTDESVVSEIEKAGREGCFAGAAFFIEPFEPLKADVRRFLLLLRKTLGEDMPVLVFLAEFAEESLVPPDEELVEVWERGVRELGDPWLQLIREEVKG